MKTARNIALVAAAAGALAMGAAAYADQKASTAAETPKAEGCDHARHEAMHRNMHARMEGRHGGRHRHQHDAAGTPQEKMPQQGEEQHKH